VGGSVGKVGTVGATVGLVGNVGGTVGLVGTVGNVGGGVTVGQGGSSSIHSKSSFS